MYSAPEGPRCSMKAIFLPSGDHAGSVAAMKLVSRTPRSAGALLASEAGRSEKRRAAPTAANIGHALNGTDGR
jgi:hypothetical protein